MSEDDKYNGLELIEQECKGHYVFKNINVSCTQGFALLFGESENVVRKCMDMINERYPEPDYLQVFSYNGVTFYAISPCEEDELEELPEEERRVQFLLASEY